MVFDGFFDSIFGGLLNWDPNLSLLIISFLLTLFITIFYKYATDQEMLKSIKKELKDLQNEIKELKDNPKKVMEKQKELMEKNLKMLSHTLKPSLYTFIPLIIMFGWLRSTYSPLGDIYFGLSWFWIYMISSIVFSIALRKILKVH